MTLSNPIGASERVSPPAIAIAGLGKAFRRGGGEVEVLRDISLEVPEGRFVAILGASGCGKSTLLHITAGLETADCGHIRRNTPEGYLGYVFQDDRLLPWRSAMGNVEFALQPLRLAAAERRGRARHALELVGLAAFADHYPFQLSGGMRSRVAIARALVRKPGVLLLDEPFSRLDGPTRSALHRQLLDLKRDLGMTVVMVTHDVDEAVALADRIVVLSPRPGRVRQVVEIDRGHPRDPYGAHESALARQLRQALLSAHAHQEESP